MKLLVLILPVLLWSASNSQSLTKEYIENWILLCDSTIALESKELLYVIEGVPFDSKQVSNQLSVYSQDDPFLILTYLQQADIKGNTWSHNPNLLVVIIGNAKRKLKNKEKVERIGKLNERFGEENIPVLIINGKTIEPAQSKGEIEKLNKREFLYSLSINHAPTSIYGPNAKNGLVKVWTKNNK